LFLQTLSLVIVILGILKFAQEAPELIKTFFGNSGKYSIKPSDQKSLKGGIGAIGTMTNRALNKAGNFARIQKNNKLTGGQKAWEHTKNAASLLNPFGYGKAGYQGYNATKDGKILDGINSASSKHLTDKGMVYKAKSKMEDALDLAKHYYGTSYMGLNSDLLTRENELIDSISKIAKAVIDRVDSHGRMGDLNDYYAQRKEQAKKSGNMALVDTLEQQRKAAVKSLRKAIAEEKTSGRVVEMNQNGDDITFSNGNVDKSKIDMQYLKTVEELKRGLKESVSSIEGILKESNAAIKDMGNNVIPNTVDAISKEITGGNVAAIDDLNKKLTEKMGANQQELAKIRELAQGKKDKK